MSTSESLRQLARQLDSTAEQVRALTSQRARQVVGITWECPRGNRAERQSGHLAARAAVCADHLRQAAAEFGRAASDVDASPLGRVA